MVDSINSLLLSTSDVQGGAARAAFRLHRGLGVVGVNSRMLVRTKGSDDPTVLRAFNFQQGLISRATLRFSQTVDRIPLTMTRTRSVGYWSTAWFPTAVQSMVHQFSPDVVHLHWINGGFVPVGALSRFKVPVIWTLHDEWAFTGGCHYTGECSRFKVQCGSCPQLMPQRSHDLSEWVWRKKQRQWAALDFVVVTPSRWLAKQALSSALFQKKQVHVIPNGIDTAQYQPIDRLQARRILALPEQGKLILFGAMDPASDSRKGFQYLQEALHKLQAMQPTGDFSLAILGASQLQDVPELGFPVHYLGQLHDDVSLALVYATADVFVLPSVYENLANTVMEALACGRPCVAFGIGGNPDMIDHRQNGYLATPYDTDDLANGIAWILEDEQRWHYLSKTAREKVITEFAIEKIAQRYYALYTQVLETGIQG